MRIYTYGPGDINKVIDAWATQIDEREKYSPLAGAWYSDIGGLNKWVHMWAFESFKQCLKIRAETRAKGVWPPQGGTPALRQENRILLPAACSPMQ